jgi:hypothetical protein
MNDLRSSVCPNIATALPSLTKCSKKRKTWHGSETINVCLSHGHLERLSARFCVQMVRMGRPITSTKPYLMRVI